jgi:Spy/CpxP family protein refolding chaperone
MRNTMKIKLLMVAALALALAAGTVAIAQEQPNGQSGGMGGMLGHRGGGRARMTQVESEIEANPKLIDDPKYLAAHPHLQRMLERHPEMRQKIERDPKGFFDQINSRHAGG